MDEVSQHWHESMSSKYIADYSKSLRCFSWILVCLPLFLPFLHPSSSLPPPSTSTRSSLPPPLPLFVHTHSSAYISKVMWNVTNDPPAASPLKSILGQKDKMSRGRIFSAAVWPRSVFVLQRMVMMCVDYHFFFLCVLNVKRNCRLVRLAAVLCWSAFSGRFYWGSHVDCVCPCVPQVDLGLILPHPEEHTHTPTRLNPPPLTPYHQPAEQPRQH